MKEPTDVLKVFKEQAVLVEGEIKNLLDARHPYGMYDMMRYFFGFADEAGRPIQVYGGKRFRSGLCLLIGHLYAVKKPPLSAAAAIEIFHNFTLIHDDIEDNDEMRRGRPTVWKVWGLNHGINSGDAQLILAHMELSRMVKKEGETGIRVREFLEERFLEVIEGQYLDFLLSDADLGSDTVTEEAYFNMITKKTSVLVGAAPGAAARACGLPESEQQLLWEYGVNLGLAYQLCDDLVSIWGAPEFTGKIAQNDLYEKKKTLPVIRCFASADSEKRALLAKIYNKTGKLQEHEVKEVYALLDASDAYDYVWENIKFYKKKSDDAISQLRLSIEGKETLRIVSKVLLPDVRVRSRIARS